MSFFEYLSDRVRTKMVRLGLKRKFKFFVSYKWKGHREEAWRMRQLADPHGGCLWDWDWIGVKEANAQLDNEEIAAQLKWALGSSEYIFFFEASDELAATVGGGAWRRATWHGFEHAFIKANAKKVIVLYHSKKLLTFGFNARFKTYRDLEDALTQTLNAIGVPGEFDEQPGNNGGGGHSAELPATESTSDLEKREHSAESVLDNILSMTKAVSGTSETRSTSSS